MVIVMAGILAAEVVVVAVATLVLVVIVVVIGIVGIVVVVIVHCSLFTGRLHRCARLRLTRFGMIV